MTFNSSSWAMVLVVGMTAATSAADETPQPKTLNIDQARAQAVSFLKTSQNDEGGWTTPQSTGITALVTYGLLRSDVPPTDLAVAKALKHIVSFAQPDGRLCGKSSRHAGYETAVSLMALQAANKSGEYTELIKKADQFLRNMQFGDDDDVARDDDRYGGTGYGPNSGRPDLSNTAFLVEALQAAGAKPDDPAMQRALVFISRCQNLESEHNTSPAAAKVNDGGFYYTVSAGGQSPAGDGEVGGLRSYGSMTYAGLKSMVYAGLTPEDQRVKAALGWIRQNYTVKSNPGMGDNGLFYYYQLFAKALDTVDLKQFDDAKGESHNWRKELAEQLIAIQKPNGSWVNSAPRWMEGDPNLVTAYSLIALSYCKPSTEK